MSAAFFKCFGIVFVSLLLSACVNNPLRKPEIKFSDRTTLAFTGKGAAAGMMMDAYLGGAGVAIGIAIDEGIAKNIAENITHSYPDFNVISLLDKKLVRKSIRPTKVEIVTYGFRSVAGEGDLAAAWLVIKFIGINGSDVIVKYPQDFGAAKTAELSVVKSNAQVAYDMLNIALADVVNSLANNSKPEIRKSP